MAPKLLAAVMAGLCLSSCQPTPIPLIFVNTSDVSVRVRLTAPLHGSDPTRCRFETDHRQVTQQHVTGSNWTSRDWSAARTLSLDLEACEVSVEVPAGATLLVDRNGGFCSDYYKVLSQSPPPQMQFTSFSVEAGNARVVLEGWKVAAAFEKKRDLCVLRYPS